MKHHLQHYRAENLIKLKEIVNESELVTLKNEIDFLMNEYYLIESQINLLNESKFGDIISSLKGKLKSISINVLAKIFQFIEKAASQLENASLKTLSYITKSLKNMIGLIKKFAIDHPALTQMFKTLSIIILIIIILTLMSSPVYAADGVSELKDILEATHGLMKEYIEVEINPNMDTNTTQYIEWNGAYDTLSNAIETFSDDMTIDQYKDSINRLEGTPKKMWNIIDKSFRVMEKLKDTNPTEFAWYRDVVDKLRSVESARLR